jgi:hypothetical protein
VTVSMGLGQFVKQDASNGQDSAGGSPVAERKRHGHSLFPEFVVRLPGNRSLDINLRRFRLEESSLGNRPLEETWKDDHPMTP